MKKILFVLLFAIILLGGAFAVENRQKIYSVTSPAYFSMEKLYLIAGKTVPSSAGPWSEDELQRMLSKINRSALNEAGKAYYDYVESLITSTPKIQDDDNFSASINLEANFENYLHSDTDNYVNEDDWFHGFESRKPFLNLNIETWPAKNFYGYMEFTFGTNIGWRYNTLDENTYKPISNFNAYYAGRYNFNIPILREKLTGNDAGIGHETADLDATYPDKAIASFGGNHWFLVAGRDKLNWGNGETGNLMLSSAFPRHNLLMFSTYFNRYKYSLVATLYPTDNSIGDDEHVSLDGYKSLVAHRGEVSLFDDKLRFALTESVTAWSMDYLENDGHTIVHEDFNLFQINPFGFMHNEYISYNSNSLVVVDLNYSLVKGLDLYGQFALDEMQAPGEDGMNPSAFGLMAGTKYATTINNGIFKASLEYVKTDPYLYLRGLFTKDNARKGFGYDAVYRSISGDGILYKKMFITYPYGNDVIILDAKASYEVPEKYNLGLELMLKRKGVMNAYSSWGQFINEYRDMMGTITTPTTISPFDDYELVGDTLVLKEDAKNKAVENTFVLSLTGETITPIKGLKFYHYFDFIFTQNKGNQKGSHTFDTQATLGFSYIY